MRKIYFKSTIYTMFFVVIDFIVTSAVISVAIYSINQNGEYRFDFAWMIIFFVAFFFIIFNAHFVYIGAFSRAVLDENGLKIKKAIRTNTQIKWEKIVGIRTVNEIRHYIKTVEVPVIIIDAYDEVSKTDVAIQIDYRKRVYDAIIDGVNNADAKTIEKMEKYFN